MSSTLIFGATGFVGSNMLTTLIANNAFPSIKTIGRRAPKETSPKAEAIVEPDTTKWTQHLESLTPTPTIVISALGSTRAQAGGIANQWKIDHDLNVEIARAAKAAGVRTFVFISSGGTRGLMSKYVPYSQMKIGVEDTIMELGFENAIIMRPGALFGEREIPKAPLAFKIMEGIGSVSPALKDMIGQTGTEVARAAVVATQMAQEGKAPSKFWVVEQADVVRMGRTEWKE